MSNFGEDVITVILSRLPVKSLLRFRCVSKSWCCLISDSHFVKLHLLVQATKEPNLMICDYFQTYSLTHITEKPSKAEAIPITLPPIVSSKRGYMLISNSCNGLVCFHTQHLHVIWNPSTKQFKQLPSPPPPDPLPLPAININGVEFYYGFGYNSLNHDYKLVKITQYFDLLNDVCYVAQVVVYSLVADSWHPIEFDKNSHSYVFIDTTAEFVDGTLYWIALRSTPVNELIVCFDIKDEKFHQVPHPDSVKDITCLGVLRGNLCFLEQCNTSRVADVWLMRKDCGVKEEWTKLFTIDLNKIDLPLSRFTKVLCFTEKGQVLLTDQKVSLLLYDPRLEKAQALRLHDGPKSFTTMPYVESLVSL